MKMGILLKEIILKMKNVEKENIIFMKEEHYNLNLILNLHKYQKYIYQMVQYMLVNKEMVQDKDQVKQHMLMDHFMMDNGKMIKKMVMDIFNILIILNIMVNGKKI